MSENYWLDFNLKNKENILVTHKKEVLDILYPNTINHDIAMKNISSDILIKILNQKMLFNNDNSLTIEKHNQKIFHLITNIITGKHIKYYELTCDDELYPLEGIFWNFWFIIWDIDNNTALSFSGCACD